MRATSLLRFSSLAVLAAAASAQSPLLFRDETAALGLTWAQLDSGVLMGAGGAFLDYDGDGWQDIILSGGSSTPTLFRNRGGLGFVEVPHANFSQPAANEQYMCVTIADIDSDGDPDVFFGVWGQNRLYRNDGAGRFTDITSSELAGYFEFTTSAAFDDYDRDGNLDLYVANYITPPFYYPSHTPTPNLLFRGNGDGTFTDVTTPTLAGAGTTLATTWTDYDGDGDSDLFVANDFGAFVEPNRVIRNDGPDGVGGWTFTEVSTQLGADLGIYCMGIAIGDIDRDLDFDYYFTNLGTNALLRNDGSAFVDIAAATGTELTWDPDENPPLLATSWGTGFFDFDNDGWLDLYVSNGYIPAAASILNGRNTRNSLFHHDGPSMTFTELGTAAGMVDQGIGRGCAFADFDRDGDVDILQINCMGPPVLLRNVSTRAGYWFAFEPHGRISNRDGLGARVEVDLGTWTAVREISRNDSFETSSAPSAHFGLGNVAKLRSVKARWPSGIEQSLFDLPVDVSLEVLEPIVTIEGAKVFAMRVGSGYELVAKAALQNHSDAAVTVLVAPQLRNGYGAGSSGPAGDTFWAGAAQFTTIPAGAARRVTYTTSLGAGPIANPTGVDFVWTVVDPGLGMDQFKAPLRKR